MQPRADLDGDAVIQAIKLALNGTANYPIEPLAWWCGTVAVDSSAGEP
jgi:hypothetical protein